jgi:hypothetical protein
MEPLRQRPGLDPDKLDDAGPLRQPLDERVGLAWNLTLPLHRAVSVDNADRGLGKRYVEPDENTHGRLLVGWLNPD